MIKRIILTLLQFIVFIVLLAVGGNWDAVNLALEMRALQQHKTATMLVPVFKYTVGQHIFIADGLIFATVLLVLILLLLVLLKKLHPWAWLAVLAYGLAVCLCFAMKLGIVPAENPAQATLSSRQLTVEGASLQGRGPGSLTPPVVHG